LISLVTLAEAKTHLHILNNDSDADIAMKIQEASALIMMWEKHDTIPDSWVVNTSPLSYDIPANVRIAVLMQTASLYYAREGDVASVLPEAIRNCLQRPPTLA
jgi:hypothetical protein